MYVCSGGAGGGWGQLHSGVCVCGGGAGGGGGQLHSGGCCEKNGGSYVPVENPQTFYNFSWFFFFKYNVTSFWVLLFTLILLG